MRKDEFDLSCFTPKLAVDCDNLFLMLIPYFDEHWKAPEDPEICDETYLSKWSQTQVREVLTQLAEHINKEP